MPPALDRVNISLRLFGQCTLDIGWLTIEKLESGKPEKVTIISGFITIIRDFDFQIITFTFKE